MRLDADDAAGAHASASRYLRGLGGGAPIESSAAFELLVPIRIRLRDIDAARRAHERLAAIADDVGTAALRAAERFAAGRVALADRDADGEQSEREDASQHERCSRREASRARGHRCA